MAKIVEINAQKVEQRINAMLGFLEKPQDLMKAIGATLEAETLHNFEKQGRPSWVPLSAATKAERLKRNNGKSVLQILEDSGLLKSSIAQSSGFDEDSAWVGSNRRYAAAHQFGATIERPAHSVKTRLRTDRKGELLRQGKDGKAANLAVFARQKGRDPHKQFRETWHEVGAYTINIPARPFLPFVGGPTDAVLQPETEKSVLAVVTRLLGGAL